MRIPGLLAVAIGCGIGLWGLIGPAPAGSAPAGAKPDSVERDVRRAFAEGHHDNVLRLLEGIPKNRPLPPDVLRAGVRSALRVGRTDAALALYARLIPPGKPDDPALLRDLAWAIITGHVRDPQEHLRIAAYVTLVETADRSTIPLFEDGLLDTSVMVRARAAEGLARTGATAPALARALDDPAPSVRIAALNALGTRVDPALRPVITRLSKSEDGVLHIFALAALVRLGQTDALDDIAGEATLPDAELRMAALGALGQLKRPAGLPILNQSVYDPDPSVRAFAAGALGEFGSPKGEPALLHALVDESPRVRGVAAASLGRLKLAQSLPVLRQAARDPVELVRVGAVEGLLRLGDNEAVLLAADLAKHQDPSVRGATAQAVALSGNRKALLVVESLLKDQQPQPRLMAVRALGKLGGRAGPSLLKQALNDSDPAIRIAAAGSLIKLLTAK